MIYRVLSRLAVGPSKNRYIERGSVISGDRLAPRIMAILVRKGHLSPVSAPPLDAFPGWKLRAVRFAKAGYDTLGILETGDAVLAEAIGSNVQSIQKWKGELREFLGLGDEPIEFCCGGKRKVVRGEEPQLEVKEASVEPEIKQAIDESEQEKGNGTDE